MHKIIATTDKKYIGLDININDYPIKLDHDTYFYPDKVAQISSTNWILSNSSYIIETKEN